MSASETSSAQKPSTIWWEALALGVVYFALSAASVAFTRFEGGAAFLWPATAPLLAIMAARPLRAMPILVLGAALASWCDAALFGTGPLVAIIIALATVGEAAISALILRRRRDDVLDLADVRTLGFFVVVAGAISPALSGLIGAAVIVGRTGQAFWPNWTAWFVAHSLGTVTFAPLSLLIVRGEAAAWLGKASRALRWETLLLLLWMGLTTCYAFGQEERPLLFLPLLPLSVATFRLGKVGAAMSLVLLTAIGGALTATGHGPIGLIHDSLGERAQFFQVYLVVALLMTLPAGAELKRREQLFLRTQESEAAYRVMAENAGDTILHAAPTGEIRFASPSVLELTGLGEADMIGRRPSDFICPDDVGRFEQALKDAVADASCTVTVEYRAVAPTGDYGWREARLRSYLDEQGGPTGVVLVIRDITARKQAEDALAVSASTDPLTALPNRRAFTQRLAEVHRLAKAGEEQACLAILDIDHFKRINDVHGHPAGDAVLSELAGVVRRQLRGSDMLARIGGEEFGIILCGASVEQAALTCERVRNAVEASKVGQASTGFMAVTVSLGVSPMASADTAEECYQASDKALYQAKRAGRNRFKIAA